MISLKLKNKLKKVSRVIRKNVFTNFYNNIIRYKNEMNKIKQNYRDLFYFWELLQYLPLWLLKLNSDSLLDEKPWIPFSSCRYLKRIIKKDMIIFEYGSGAFYFIFSKIADKVISIEHNQDWYLRVYNKIKLKNYKNCEIILVEPENFKDLNLYDYNDLESYKTSDEVYKNMSFESYVKTIDLYPDFYFDIIFIDGRARPFCVKHAVNKLKVNGYLILDNSDVEVYKKIYEYLDNKHWKKLDFRPLDHMFKDFGN